MTEVHATAIVAPGAILGEGTVVGPYTVIGPKVVVGKNNRIGPHVVLEGNTVLGDDNQIFQFASIGSAPQDLKYQGEESVLQIGSGNIIREYVTLQPGTAGGGMKTTIGDKNLFMASSHVGHDCHIGSGNIFANGTALSGHVSIGNLVTLGGMTGVHQYTRLGDYAFLGAGSMVNKDIPPFCLAQGDRAELVGLNVIGLRRNGFSSEDIRRLKTLYRSVFGLQPGSRMAERIERLRQEFPDFSPGLEFLTFVENSERGVTFPRHGHRLPADD